MYHIEVNCLALTAVTRMLEGLLAEGHLKALDSALVNPAVLATVAEDAPTKTILCAGTGTFEAAQITLWKELYLGAGEDVAESILTRLGEITEATGSHSRKQVKAIAASMREFCFSVTITLIASK